jgi:2-polyprenyl-6-methoxyphenol hydroxylase-like FAD-dependent oxidoreductase
MRRWECRRLQVARTVLRTTDQATRLMTASSATGQLLRRLLLRSLGQALMRRLAELNLR